MNNVSLDDNGSSFDSSDSLVACNFAFLEFGNINNPSIRISGDDVYYSLPTNYDSSGAVLVFKDIDGNMITSPNTPLTDSQKQLLTNLVRTNDFNVSSEFNNLNNDDKLKSALGVSLIREITDTSGDLSLSVWNEGDPYDYLDKLSSTSLNNLLIDIKSKLHMTYYSGNDSHTRSYWDRFPLDDSNEIIFQNDTNFIFVLEVPYRTNNISGSFNIALGFLNKSPF